MESAASFNESLAVRGNAAVRARVCCFRRWQIAEKIGSRAAYDHVGFVEMLEQDFREIFGFESGERA